MKREVIWPYERDPDALLSPVIRAGDLVFTAGMVGRDPTTSKMVSTDIQGQTHQTLKNIRTALEAAGTSMDNVVKVTALVADIEDRVAFNDIYRSYFVPDRPVRTCVQAGRLGEGVKVEVEVIAVMPDSG